MVMPTKLAMIATLMPDEARAQIRRALDASGGNVTRAASALTISRVSLSRLLVSLGLADEIAARWPARRSPAGQGKAGRKKKR